MKKNLRTIFAFIAAVIVGVGGVDAAAQRNINANACDTVYTNYYFFLDVNDESYFANGVSSIQHDTIAKYSNNSYLTDNFNTSNLGYGQVDVTRTTTTSSDGITSMSIKDFYAYYLKAFANSNGTYQTGNNNFIVAHTWYSIDSDGTTTHRVDGYDFTDYSKEQLANASLNAVSTITVQSAITPEQINPFEIKINRHYYGSLTGYPLSYGNKNLYIQPALYYIQYCEDKNSEYTIEYNGNGTNINIPGTTIVTDGSCTNISKTVPIRDGYTFLGWSTNKSATSPMSIYDAGSEYCGENGSIVLYAVWQSDSTVVTPSVEYYYIYYKSNTTDTVTNMPDVDKQDINYDVYISVKVPVRDGYTFLGWSTDATATKPDTNYNGGTLYQSRKDLILYAVWQKNDTSSVLPTNPQTGVTDYLLPFGGVISASGAGLGLLKKKKTFKQF